MFVLGHLGIGGRLAAPFIAVGERRLMLLGTLLPDLIDKPIYYGLSLATGRHGAALGLISGTRTFGHTALFALLVWLLLRRRHGGAIALGMATHLALDALGDLFAYGAAGPPAMAAVFFPLLGPHFPIATFTSISEHAATLLHHYVVAGELIGASLLLWEWQRKRADL